MYLIILLGVVGKLALVSGECDLGTPKLKNVDWNKLAGRWYLLYHTPNKAEDNLDCVLTTYDYKKTRSITLVHDKRERHLDAIIGKSSKFTTNGYFNNFSTRSFWSGKYLLLAIDRDSFFVMTFCQRHGGNRNAYIGFRKRSPDEATLEKAFKAFNETGLAAIQIVKWSADHC